MRRLKEMDELAVKLTTSMDHDKHIFYYDILVDYAHVLTLYKSGIISREDLTKILKALKKVKEEGFEKLPKAEDVHEAIEKRVIEIAGNSGKKMHTGRSRNDEIATCLRLFTRDKLLDIATSLLELRAVIMKKAEENDTIMPGFTHMQYAQPTRLSHYLIAYHDMFDREFERFLNCFKRVNLSPLGSAAFASTSFNLDREYTASLLGFSGVVENSMDAVSSRDFLIESVFVAASTLLDLSRICEEIILWASEFNFIDLPDEYASISSIMPQKKNPDVAEILRAKAGKMIGYLTSAMSIYKALPFAYNRDFQEMNQILYHSLYDTEIAIRVMAGMFEKLKFREDIMTEKAGKNFSYATEIADMLVRKGIPFRDAHKIVGELVNKGVLSSNEIACEIVRVAKKLGIEINLEDEEITNLLSIEKIVERRNNMGGTSKTEIKRMIKKRVEKLEKDKKIIAKIRDNIAKSLSKLEEEVKMYAES